MYRSRTKQIFGPLLTESPNLFCQKGGWIRTRSGRHKRLWKKKENLRRRLRKHVFCNATQSWLLDKMVTKYWRQPRYYVDDPYEPYHTREEFLVTRKKPLP
uniref:Large ribosomal subunit protein bL35m n=1 Tax=Timema monikensis TaxID=170555 RepID=A0A7R9DXZ4_9NEOP|nr:unnamed protein product [Timema monikensis]